MEGKVSLKIWEAFYNDLFEQDFPLLAFLELSVKKSFTYLSK